MVLTIRALRWSSCRRHFPSPEPVRNACELADCFALDLCRYVPLFVRLARPREVFVLISLGRSSGDFGSFRLRVPLGLPAVSRDATVAFAFFCRPGTSDNAFDYFTAHASVFP